MNELVVSGPNEALFCQKSSFIHDYHVSCLLLQHNTDFFDPWQAAMARKEADKMASWTGRSMGGHISQELIYRIDPS
jgi:hypothetical protein